MNNSHHSAGLVGLLSTLLLLGALAACSSSPQVKSENNNESVATESESASETIVSEADAAVEDTSTVATATTNNSTSTKPAVDTSPERLVLAARYGQQDLLRYLLDVGGDVNASDAYGNTALMAAASNDQREMVQMLLARGARINAANNEEQTALMGASIKGYYELVHDLVRSGANVNTRNNEGETALFLAVKYGHYRAARVLLNAGASPNFANTVAPNFANSGFTPLMYAANHGLGRDDVEWHAMADLLLQNGADPNLINSHSKTALDYARQLQDTKIVAVLTGAGAKDESLYAALTPDEALLKAARLGDGFQARKAIVDDGANPNYSDNKNGITPLLAAAYEGHVEMVRLLIENGSEVNMVPSGLRQFAMSKSHAPMSERGLMEAASLGDTALGTAVRQGHTAVARYLLGQGARLDIPNRQGETPLFVATSEGNLEMVKLLLAIGADPDTLEQDNRLTRLSMARSSMGKNSVLIVAVQKGHVDVVSALADAGANMNYRGFIGKTALYEAVETGRQNIVRILLDYKADPNINNMAGVSPLMQASQMGNRHIVADLLKAGANVNTIEKPELGYVRETVGTSGMTALLFAARSGHAEVVKLLLESGAETSIHNSDGKRALDEAIEGGYEEIVQLLSPGANRGSVTLSTVEN